MAHVTSTFVIVGGGIAGVSCVETLSCLVPDSKVLLVTSSDIIKAITNYEKVSRTLERFDVEEKKSNHIESGNVTVLKNEVIALDAEKHELHTRDGQSIHYKKLCICSGARPKVIECGHTEHVVTIRDTESVKDFRRRLQGARRIVVLGNGGIATELVYEIQSCQVVWAVKDKSISATFVDGGAAEFFLAHLNTDKEKTLGPVKRHKYKQAEDDVCSADRVSAVERASSGSRGGKMGGALGPDWACEKEMVGVLQEMGHQVHVEYSVEVTALLSPAQLLQTQCSPTEPFPSVQPETWPVYVQLSNGTVYGCDFIVSATGVIPNTEPFHTSKMKVSADGGLRVNCRMETSEVDVYAAGDVCTAHWDWSPHWLQMRLWSQARQMGCYAAKCMLAAINNEDITLDFCFELFAHVTKFFNFKVVLLGKFNAQGLQGDHELLLRMTKDEEYLKVVLQEGRMKGAVLIGETDMEETFENLILNGIDLTPFKNHLLDPNIDVEDFFD